MKLNLGSGDQRIDGFLNVDLHHPTDIREDIRTLKTFLNDSIDEIYCAHVLMYIHKEELLRTFKNWYRILKIGGIAVIEEPQVHAGWETNAYLHELSYLIDLLKDVGFKEINLIRGVVDYSRHKGHWHNIKTIIARK